MKTIQQLLSAALVSLVVCVVDAEPTSPTLLAFHTPVEGVAYLPGDSTGKQKRAAAIGNVSITNHSLENPKDHGAVMDACIGIPLGQTKAEHAEQRNAADSR